MKHLMKVLSLAAVLVLAIVVMAGCGNNNQPSPATPAPVAPTPAPTATDTTPPADPVEEAQETLYLTFHYHLGHTIFDAEWPAWQQAFAHTNVVLEGTANPVATNAAEQFNLEAANQFPAHIYGGQQLASLFMQFGMQGAFLPLNDLIAEHAPNFTRILEEYPMVRAAITAPDGNIYHLPTLPDGLIEGARAWFIRQDWLDLLELDTPQTVQELEDVLVAFRDEIPPLIGEDYVWPYIDGNWHNVLRLANLWGARAYGHDAHAVRVVPREDSNEIYHAWTDPQFMYALQNISRWYGMGLIDQTFITRGGGARHELLSQNRGGVFLDFPVSSAAFNDNLAETIEGFNLVAMAPPANSFGQRVSEHQRLDVQPHGWAISHTNPDPVRTMQFMDFFYSDLGRTLLSFGAEGITFEFDANGDPQFLPYVFEQEVTPTDVVRFEMGGLRFMGYKQLFEYERQMASPAARAAFDINRSGEFAVRQLPVLSFTDDELRAINEIQPALNEFLAENIQSMILGDWQDIENVWDAFVAQTIQLGKEDLVAAYQSAFDRAMNQ